MSLSNEDGKSLIKIARESISDYFKNKKPEISKTIEDKFSEEQGAFVTLTIDGELRGCIGFTEPIFPLWEAVSKAARAAAFEDPRFPHLTEEELGSIRIEVSALTKPQLIEGNHESYEKQIEIGNHGIVIESGYAKGLLLPQVFTEYKANPRKALEMTCQKAGLAPDAWKEPDCKVYLFSAQIFTEK